MTAFNPSQIESIKTKVLERVNKFAKAHKEAGFPWTMQKIRKEYETEVQKEIATLIYQLVDLTNSTSAQDMVPGMLEGINRSHRFLQSEFWTAMVLLTKAYSEQNENMYFDGRNLPSRDLCRRMYESA